MDRKMKPVLLAIIAISIQLASAEDYCNIKSCGNNKHTVCTYPNNEPSSKCNKVIRQGLTKDEEKRVLDHQNQYRQKVASGKETGGSPGPQPAAVNMPNLQWDDELAKIAQRWANQCDFSHDVCRDTANSVVGQNIAYIATTGDPNGLKPEAMVDNWYNEVLDFPKEQASNFTGQGANNKVVGHYTQLVWGKSTHVGCGQMMYEDGKFNKAFLVCNYSPAGNFIGVPVYETK